LGCRATFNILEQCGDGYAGASKYKRAADAIHITFDGRAGGPVNRDRMLRPAAGSLNSSYIPFSAAAQFLAIRAQKARFTFNGGAPTRCVR